MPDPFEIYSSEGSTGNPFEKYSTQQQPSWLSSTPAKIGANLVGGGLGVFTVPEGGPLSYAAGAQAAELGRRKLAGESLGTVPSNLMDVGVNTALGAAGGKVFRGVSEALPEAMNPFMKAGLSGAAAGTAIGAPTGAVSNPQHPFKGAATGAVEGAGLGAAGGIIPETPPFRAFAARGKAYSADYANEKAEQFKQIPGKQIGKVTAGFDEMESKYPDLQGDIGPKIVEIKGDIDTDPIFRRQVEAGMRGQANISRPDTTLKDMMADPDFALKSLNGEPIAASPRAIKQVMNTLQKSPAVSKLGGNLSKPPDEVTSKILGHIFDLEDLLHSIIKTNPEASQTYQQMMSEYGDVMEKHKNLAPFYKFNKVLPSMESGFGGEQGQQANRQLMGDETAKEMEDVGRWRRIRESFSANQRFLGRTAERVGIYRGARGR